MEQNIIAVSRVNEYIKFLLDRDELLANLCVRGEISNYKVYPSGHHYFTLKDAKGALRCVMFRSSAQRLRFKPENGMQVVAYGRVTVFPRDGLSALLQRPDRRRRGRSVYRIRAAERKTLEGRAVRSGA